ncbi:F-box/kelch-repeat protein At3g23880-like [Silene latifolia]|uniref:F-box/kelch-repeat protein At3g23880-like n=1 Tax=Silene latifolia TaxID=37657 RepID=UPI003D782769
MGDEDSNSEKKQFVEQQSYLSDDLIIQEILTRLPIKSILRFRSVSKQWYSTLSSSDFANAHLIKSPLAYPSAPVNTLFIIDRNNCCYLFSYEDDQISCNFEDYLVRLDPEFGFENDTLQLTGSCNGLVCLNPISDKYFILWNPATHKMHKYETDVHLRRIESIDDDDVSKIRRVICGFWYASFVDDYKFIRILKRSLFNGDTNCIVHIFSLRENKWTRSDFDYGHDFLVTGHAMLTNERLYWPASVLSPGHRNIILSFDLGVEKFDVIKLERKDWLGVMGGCLSKCVSDSANKDAMLMHIYESPGVILKSIDFPKTLTLGMTSQMVGFTRTGKCFVTAAFTDGVIDFQNRMLGVVDTGTKVLQYTTLLRFDMMIGIAGYFPSLVSPFPIKELSTA